MPNKLANLIAFLLVKLTVLARPRASTQALFREVWRKLHSSAAYGKLVSLIPGKGRQPTFNEHLYRLISKNIASFYTSLELRPPALLQARIIRKEPFVILHFHDGFSFISKVLIEQDRNFTRIVDDPESYLEALEKKFPGVSCANAVGVDMFSLALANKAARKGDAICCAIDYKDNKEGSYSHVSPAMIEFSNRNKLDVFFVKSDISDDGDVRLFCWGPFNGLDAEACANSFIKLYNSHGESRRSLTVKLPGEHAAAKRNKP